MVDREAERIAWRIVAAEHEHETVGRKLTRALAAGVVPPAIGMWLATLAPEVNAVTLIAGLPPFVAVWWLRARAYEGFLLPLLIVQLVALGVIVPFLPAIAASGSLLAGMLGSLAGSVVGHVVGARLSGGRAAVRPDAWTGEVEEVVDRALERLQGQTDGWRRPQIAIVYLRGARLEQELDILLMAQHGYRQVGVDDESFLWRILPGIVSFSDAFHYIGGGEIERAEPRIELSFERTDAAA